MSYYANAFTQLQSENYAGFAGVTTFRSNANQVATYADLLIQDEDTLADITPPEVDLDDAYTRWQAADAIEQSQEATKELTRAQVLDYLRTQMFSSSPDSLATIYATLSGYVNGNQNAINALNGIGSLYETAFNTTIDTGTSSGKAFYVLAVLAIIPFANG